MDKVSKWNFILDFLCMVYYIHKLVFNFYIIEIIYDRFFNSYFLVL